MMLGADVFVGYKYDQQSRDEISVRPSWSHPLGTDKVGRDRVSRLLYGGRISIILAPAAALLSVAVALAAALSAVLVGGWWRGVARVMIDLVLSLPWLFLLLAVRALLPLNTSPAASVAAIFAVLGLLGWAGPARVLMAAAERQLRSDHIIFARASGVSPWRLVAFHLAPNLRPVVWAQLWITIPAFLLSEANLAVLGLGVCEPLPSWGSLLREMQDAGAVRREPWVAAPLILLVIALSCCQWAWPADEYSI
jgi:ABC-type dipeptide/oligopeptide/nickel transport system permease subunit